jgi:hypothetical protein
MPGRYDEWVFTSPGVGIANINEIRASLPVVGLPHKGCSQSLNWLLGRGHPLAVCGPQVIPAWETHLFSFWVHPDDLHPNFLWDISISAIDGTNAPRVVNGTIGIADSTQIVTFTTSSDGSLTRVAARQDVEPSNTPMEINCVFSTDFPDPGEFGGIPTFDVYLIIHGIHVCEMPQLRLNGYGVAMSTLDARQPIYAQAGAISHESITALPNLAQLANDSYARRGALFSWYSPFTDELNQTTSTSYVEIFPVRPSVQGRLITKGQTKGNIKVNVAARVTGGTGQVRVSMTSGDSLTFDVTSTTVAWVGEQTMTANCDDPDRWETDGGIRGGTRDDVIFEMKAPSGQTIAIQGLCITEAQTDGGTDESANVLIDGGVPVTLGHEYIFVPIPYPP